MLSVGTHQRGIVFVLLFAAVLSVFAAGSASAVGPPGADGPNGSALSCHNGGGTGTISAVVFDETGPQLDSVVVDYFAVNASSGELGATGYTTDGSFEFTQPTGAYDITVSADGYDNETVRGVCIRDGETNQQTIYMQESDPNQPPVADAGPNQSATPGGIITLDGSDSYDPDGIGVNYDWSQTGGEPVTLSNRSAAMPEFTAPGVKTTMTFALRVTEDGDSTLADTDTVSVTVGAGNEPPVADAGTDRTVSPGEQVELDGTGSSDPDGDNISERWVQLSGPSVSLEDRFTQTPSFTAPSETGTARFEILVTDGTFNDTDTVEITISDDTDNTPPVAEAGPDRSVNPDDTVTLDGTGSYDPDGDELDVSWAQVGGPSVDLRDQGTFTPTLTAPSVSGTETLTFEIYVSDGSETVADTVDVTVSGGTSNSPPDAEAGPDLTAEPDESFTLDGSASSDPDGDSLSYDWTQTAGPSVSLRRGASAAPSARAPAVDSTRTLRFELTVDDGKATNSDPVEVTVTPGNTPPDAEAGPDRSAAPGDTVTLDGSESSDPDGDSLSYDWTQTEGPDVSIDDADAATASIDAPSVEERTTLTFEVTVDDGEATDSDTVEVTVTPENDPPNAELSVSPTPATAGEALTASASGSSDPDGSIEAYRWSFGDGSSATGETVSHTYDSGDEYTVELTVEDDDGATDTATETVTVETPTLRIDGISREVGGTVLSGVDLSETVSATVESENDVESVTFELDGESYTDTDGSDGWQRDLQTGDLSQTSVLTVTAETERGQTATATRSIPVLETPEWLELLVETGSVSVDATDAEIALSQQIPDPPIDTDITVPEAVPVLGGPQEFEASSEFGVTYDMIDEEATLRGEGELAVDVFDRSAEGELGAEGTVDTTDWDVESGHAYVDVKVDAIGRSVNPSVSAFGLSVGINVEVTVSPKVGLDVYFDDTNSGLQATSGSVQPGVEASAVVQQEALGVDLSGSVTGDLTGSVDVPAPYEPGATASIVGEVAAEKYGYETNVTLFNVTESIGSGAGSALSVDGNSTAELSGWERADKYGGVPAVDGSGALTAADGTAGIATAETGTTASRLTGDGLADKSPSLAFDPVSGTDIAVWSRQAPEKSVAEGRDVYVATGSDDGWTEPRQITDDRRMDTSPAVAVDDETGRAVAVWTRVDTVVPETDVSGPAELDDSTEIVYAVRPDASADWSRPRAVTDDDTPDTAPAVAHDPTADAWTLAWERGADSTAVARVSDEALGSDGAFDDPTAVEGTDPVLSPRADGGVALATANVSDGGNGTVALYRVGAEGTVERQRDVETTSLSDITVADDALAWVDGPAPDPTVHWLSAPDAAAETVDVGAVSDIDDLTLVSESGTDVLTYRGQTQDSPEKRVYYRVQRGGEWLDANPLTERSPTGLSYWQLSTALSDGGDRFRSAFLGRNVTGDQNNDVFAVQHTLRPDVALDATAADASVGETTTVDYTLGNVGDVALADPVEVTVRAGGSVVDTRTVDPLDAGENTTGTLIVTVPPSGTIDLTASTDATELTERNNGATVGPASTDLTVDVTADRAGENATVALSVDNDGAATDQPVGYELRADGETVFDGSFDGMGPDATRTVERELSVTAVSANRTVTAVVDAADRVREADESNNEWEGRLLAPDLTLWGGSVDYGAATGGVNVTVSVGNRGASATPATVTLYPENGTPVAATTNISGAADDDTTVFESVRFTGVALAANESVDVVVDSPYERRASDNALTSTVPESVAPDVARPTLPGQPEPAGDVDGDGKLEDVDGNGGADLFDALTYYNERNSDVVENNPSAFDFDGDGTAGTLFDALALFNDISG